MTATPFPALSGQQFILLTTFRKSGEAVPTPVWFVEERGKVYVYTRAESGKVKRIRANGRAELAPSDARGAVLGVSAAGKGRILPPEDEKWAEALFARKYGMQFHAFNAAGKLQRAKIAYIEIAPAE